MKEIILRLNTSDYKVYNEIFVKKIYNKYDLIKDNDIILDFGSHIGLFTIFCFEKGCKNVIGFEANDDNKKLYQKNVGYESLDAISIDGNKSLLYIANDEKNTWRHSLIKKRGRKSIEINTLKYDDVILKYKPTGIKIDIEGYEIQMLEQCDFSNLRWLIVEYSFDCDKSIPRFLKIIERLRTFFKSVKYDKVKSNELEYRYVPQCTMIYCFNFQ